jgi:hypothetical protein
VALILDALGRKQEMQHAKRSVAKMLLYGIAAFGIGFAGLAGVVLLFAPSEAGKPATRSEPPPSAPPQAVPSIVERAERPRTTAAPPIAPTPAGRA